jgi:hypothetical protein
MLAGDGDPVILSIDFVGELASLNNFFNPTADSLSALAAFVSGSAGGNSVPDDDIIAYITVRHDLINNPLDVIITNIAAVAVNTGQVRVPAVAISKFDLLYDPDREITGLVAAPGRQPVSGVVMVLVRPDTTMRAMTGADGTYLFSGVPAQGGGTLQVEDYDRILPRSERINGVNVADLAIIIRSILGIATVEDSRAQLAGDVSGDGSLDVNDLILIQSYTLGRSDELGDAPYFKFFTTEGMLEQVEFEQVIADDLRVDFTVVKMGDVNFSGF